MSQQPELGAVPEQKILIPDDRDFSEEESTVAELQNPMPEFWNFSEKEKENLRTLEEALPKAKELESQTRRPKVRWVTHILRDNESFKRYFEPNVIAIGPLHHSEDPKSKFYIAELAKLKVAALFVQRSGRTKEALYHKIKEELESLKACYDSEEMNKWDDEQLAFIFLVDGCALLHFIDCAARDHLENLKFKIDLLTYANLDLFLLENQLPYQLLDLLMSLCSDSRARELKNSIEDFISFNVMSPAEQQNTTRARESQQLKPAPAEAQQPAQLLALLRGRLIREVKPTAEAEQQNTTRGQESQQQKPAPAEAQQPAHLLALFRERLIKKVKPTGAPVSIIRKTCERLVDFFIFKERNGRSRSRHYRHTFRSIKELKERGILFRVSKTSNIKDICFGRDILNFCLATLTLPPLSVDDSTGPKFMNLIAYEMSYDFENNFEVTSYISFLDSLIDRVEDVKELRDVGVLHNELGSDQEVADLFNIISSNLVPNPEAYLNVKQAIQEHCNSAWATNGAQLYYSYFRNPWSFLAFMGAIAGLFFTATQSYYSVYGG